MEYNIPNTIQSIARLLILNRQDEAQDLADQIGIDLLDPRVIQQKFSFLGHSANHEFYKESHDEPE